MTTAERSKLSNQSWVNTWDETQLTIKNKLWQASTSTDGYLTSTDWNTFNNKQWAISDLETIRSNASAWKNASDTIATYWDVVTHDANEFATASQWAKADTALQSGDNVSELVNDAWYVTDAYHDSTKQDKLIAWANIQIAADWKTISATDTTYVAWDFDIKDLADSTGLRTEWSWKQDELIAWNNIQIAADWKTISATDTTYTAWPGISISNNNVISNTQTSAEWWNITWTLSDQTDLNTALGWKQDILTAWSNVTIENICSNDMQWPAPDGFHVPLNTEWQTVYDIWTALGGWSSDWTNLWIALKLPFAGLRNYSSAGIIGQGTFGNYWSSSHYNTNYAYLLFFGSTALNPQNYSYRAYGFSVRCFKDSPTTPTSSWTKLYWTSIEAGWIFWSSADWLISLSSDGSNWLTIADKNLWATTVWNNWDTLSQTNCGYYYQRWNNYGFPRTWSVATSSTQVDANNYWPWNYYSSSTFITSDAEPYTWDSSDNENLWWWVSQWQSCALTISSHDTTYTAGTWISIDANNVISSTQTSAEWGNISWTLSNQTDLQTALDAKQDDMVILSYGHSTWNDFITAYQKNWVVYCRASSQSNPATGTQWRLAFMAYVNNADNPTEVEFQYYRSRSDHNTSANQLDEVYVYKLVPTSGWTWTVTQRNTAAKATAWTWINLTFGSGNMTIANTWVTSINSQTWDVTLTIPTVPTNVSDFVNDAWYITANDLPTVDTAMSDSSTNAVQNNVIKNYVDTQVQEATSWAVSDTAYSSAWDWITGIAPSKNAVYDKISAMDTTIAWKQDTISDLSTIRTGAWKWATAVQPWDNVSTLTNDAGFITKAVNDLTNYYTKSETYTKAEVADYVANFAWFKVVATLPTTDIKTTIIYLLWPVGTWADKYEEYIYSNNAWVMIWETSVDLTNYFNTSTDNSDSVTEGSTNLFLTSAERTKLSNTSGTNTGDETKATIQSKLGAATSSNDWYLTSADWSTFNSKQNALTAWDNIDITNNVISATWLQNKLTAWDNITITENCESDMQWPCDSGFHIPLKSEWEWLKTIMTSLSLTTWAQYKTNLHMPFVGYRAYSDGLVRNQANSGDYWASNIEAAGRQNAYYMSLYSSDRNIDYNYFGYGYSIRAFKNEYVAPTSSWTVIAWTLWNAWIFWNSTDWLITVTNWTTWYTIQDKNVWATTVYNDWDTLSEANMGNLFQRWNNYWFSSSTSVTPTTSTTQVDTSSYWPENPYYSSTYIIDSKNWQSTTNGDLWWWESLWTHCQNTISSNVNYIAWSNVTIEEVCESDMRWPAPSGYHVPSISEMDSLCWILTTTFSLPNKATTLGTYLKMPRAGFRNLSDASIDSVGSAGMYWTSSPEGGNDAYVLNFSSSGIYPQTYQYRSYGFSIRCFKNSPVIPDSSWTTLYNWSSVATNAWVFYNSTLWLISVSWDGTTWYTIQDKNLWATTVYNYWDTLTDANCWWYFQWWNNYMFPAANSSETITTSSTQVDVSWYGPGNYYSSSTWITIYTWQDATSDGTNLWWWVTQLTQCGNMISATDTTYESKTAASGWTDVSLVTTWEKYTWNNKANASDITVKAYSTTWTMDLQTFMAIVNGLAINGIAPIIIYNTEPYYYERVVSSSSAMTLYFYAPSNWVSNWTLYNKRLTASLSMSTYEVTITQSNENLALGSWDMSYSDFWWQAKTWATITLDLASTYTPSANFTVNAPSTIKDWQTYILRVNNGATAYTMTLWTNVTNPFDTDITLTANWVDQFVFLAIGWALELQPEWWGGGIAPAANSPINVKYIWAGTQAQYEALSSYDNNTVYLTV